MLTEPLYLSAFVMGLLGTTHCAGMCGGIVSALTIGIDPQQRSQRALPYLFSYNSGRILSYMVAGGAVAALGGTLNSIGGGIVIRQLFTLLSALLMILLGLYLSGWWPRAIVAIERGGAHLWQRIEPLARNWIPIRSTPQALVAGLLWGWLPCGLVYTALLWSLSSESALQGALLMGSFGLGTLPALLGIGLFSSQLADHLQKRWIRASAGIMVGSFGIFQLTTLL
jgi:sulfite exporter TauE/SafE